MRAARWPGSSTGIGSLKKIMMPSPAKRSSVPSCSAMSGAHRGVVLAQHRLHLLGLGAVGERREAAQVDEHVADLAAMRREDRALAGGEDRVGDRGEKKRFSRPSRSISLDLLGDARLERAFSSASSSAWRRTSSCSALTRSSELHAREQLRLVDRLGEEIVGARLDALDALLRADRAT